MASTSSSQKPHYDVFINHRGPDVKHKLASTIYQMLDLIGVQAFLDQDVLELGDSFPEEIKEAIDSALVHIAIFSPKYAESPWCLDELLWMLETKAPIIPVFYDVQPSDLRHARKGLYANAFHQYKKKRRHDPQQIKEWEEALKRVSNLSGSIMGGEGDERDEGNLSRAIVETALRMFKKVPIEIATFSAGFDEAVQDFENVVGSSTGSQNLQIVGIVGMAGSGKTTLAKEIYKRKCSSFYRSSFLLNDRHAALRNNLHRLQQNLLEDLCKQHRVLDKIYGGKAMLARNLSSMAVLIVFDDVHDAEEMRALSTRNFGRGSLIIITTRDKMVLNAWGISSIYHMKQLDPFNAKKLFCAHAFLCCRPEKIHIFEDLIDIFVEACNGLPLSLIVLGGMLKFKSRKFWESQVVQISLMTPLKIADCLKLSYDALDPEVQQMFLDVACFFIGGEKSLVVEIWDGSGWKGELGWETLVNKCLVGLDENNRIAMNNHLRDLGREIATDVAPHRIWNEEQMIIRGRTPIRGILVGWSWQYDGSFGIHPPPLEHFMMEIISRPSSPHLQLLAVKGNDFGEIFAALSRELVWLRWYDFNGTKLPLWLSLATLRVLELYKAENLEELWTDYVQPPLQLRELIIHKTSWGKSLRALPRSIGYLTHLKKIVLNGCNSTMKGLPEEVCYLDSLEFLQLSDFSLLSSLPDNFGNLKKLRTLKLERVQLTTLPKSFKQLWLLQFLDISHSKSFMFTSEILDVLEFMKELQILRISFCPRLEELPHLTGQVSLRELDFTGSGIRELPNNIDQLTKLETLQIQSNKLTSLPESLGALSSLTSLEIGLCYRLESLPEALGRLSNLKNLGIYETPVVEIGMGIGSPQGCNLKGLKTLHLAGTRLCSMSISDDCCPSLEELVLRDNMYLREIETLPGNVREIDVRNCPRLKSMRGIGGLINLATLDVDDCGDLEVLPYPPYMDSVGHTMSITNCPRVGIDDDSRIDDDELIR